MLLTLADTAFSAVTTGAVSGAVTEPCGAASSLPHAASISTKAATSENCEKTACRRGRRAWFSTTVIVETPLEYAIIVRIA